MQMVAASRMRKAQNTALAGHPFVQLLYQGSREALSRVENYKNPLLEVREVRRRAVLLIGADKGLCGALNANVFRLAAQYDPQTTLFIAAGRKAAQFVARSRRQLVAEFPYSDSPLFPEARAIAGFARDLFLKGDVDEVLVIATLFVNTLTLNPLCLQFLPIGEVSIPGVAYVEKAEHTPPGAIFEPSPEVVMDYLMSNYINIFIYQLLLDAKASEHSARMVSMKNATESAENLIRDLTLHYNKIRQGSITQELLEIAGGQAG